MSSANHHDIIMRKSLSSLGLVIIEWHPDIAVPAAFHDELMK